MAADGVHQNYAGPELLRQPRLVFHRGARAGIATLSRTHSMCGWAITLLRRAPHRKTRRAGTWATKVQAFDALSEGSLPIRPDTSRGALAPQRATLKAHSLLDCRAVQIVLPQADCSSCNAHIQTMGATGHDFFGSKHAPLANHLFFVTIKWYRSFLRGASWSWMLRFH